jgi:hypothetical protein
MGGTKNEQINCGKEVSGKIEWKTQNEIAVG